MSTRKEILVVGIREAPKSIVTGVTEAGGHSAEDVLKHVKATIQGAAEAGFDLDVMLLPPDDLQNGVKLFETKLQSQEWDGIIIGFGIRGLPQLTHSFERMMNLCRVHRPTAALGFNTEPADLLDCVTRNFGA